MLSVPEDATPTFDRCSNCGREGRTLTATNLADATGLGGRILPLRGLELEIATHVGAVTLAAGELDAAMAALQALTGAVTLDSITKTWGRSGLELTRELRKLESEPGLRASCSQELTRLCDRYDALYLTRNAVIHSFRPGRDVERLDVVKSVRSTKANPVTNSEGLFERQRLGLGELIDLFYDLDELTHQARRLFMSAVAGIG